MKAFKLLLGLILAVSSLTFYSCGDDEKGVGGWYESYEGDGMYCFIHITGKNFNYYHYATNEKTWMCDKSIPGKSGWYCQSIENCLYYVEGDYIILDNGKKAIIDGNKIDYFNRTFRKK